MLLFNDSGGLMARSPFMRPPEEDSTYQVGDPVEVFCDHEKDGDRIRDWVKGIVVQVDEKMVAVQFRTNVYLTDGWMVPDHILWFPFDSSLIRQMKKDSARPTGYQSS